MATDILFQALFFASGISLSLLLVIVLSWRFKIIMGHMKEKMGMKHSIYITLISQTLGFLSPLKVGTFITKPIATKVISSNPVNKSFFASFFEQVFDIAWQMVIIIPLLILIGEAKLLSSLYIEVVIVALVVVGIVLMLKRNRLLVGLVWRLAKLMPKGARKLGKRSGMTKSGAESMLRESVEHLSDLRLMAKMVIPTAVIILVEPFIFQLSGFIFSVSLTFWTAFFVYWISQIVGRLSGIPGGLVAKDLTSLALLVFVGVDTIVATQIVLVHRAMTMLSFIPPGGALSLYYGTRFASSGLSKKQPTF